ncbi:TlpA disulfide reductase family protein [Pedobacter caeni]|uniref:Peroxiredoxin n=1 Tax=Pedobacter caeni TaxID=288992 RepID=A0A1M4T902_9SPHI|nr:TlpA disulfide reductase family protein [Pedobacter caeni]SHE40727.1 Peroxiredoxin [Pedobacter caeni]
MKRNVILLCLIGIVFLANAQNKKDTAIAKKEYTINGYIEGLQKPYVYISINYKKDSLAVKDGKFNYKGSVDEPTSVYISYDKPFGQTFYVENVPVEIKGNANALADVEIKGGHTQSEWRVLEESTKELRAERRGLNKEFHKANNARDFETRGMVMDKQDKLQAKFNEISKAYVAKNPKSYVSLNEVRNLQYSYPEYQEYLEVYDMLDPSLKKTKLAEQIEASLAFSKRGAVGQHLADFTQNDPSGKPISLSSFKGKYVLVDFWAAWCGPCRAENPNVLKAYNEFSARGFTILGVSLDENLEKWKKAIEDDKLPWTQVSDLKGWKNEVSTYFGIRSIPANYLINAEGIIVAKNLRGVALENKLKELLK